MVEDAVDEKKQKLFSSSFVAFCLFFLIQLLGMENLTCLRSSSSTAVVNCTASRLSKCVAVVSYQYSMKVYFKMAVIFPLVLRSLMSNGLDTCLSTQRSGFPFYDPLLHNISLTITQIFRITRYLAFFGTITK